MSKVRIEMDKGVLIALWISATIALSFNLAAWYDVGVYVLHPSLTIVGLIGMLGFPILFYLRKWSKK